MPHVLLLIFVTCLVTHLATSSCNLWCDLYCDLSKATYFCYLPLPRLGLSGRLRSASSLGPHHDMRSDKKRLVPDEGATSPTQKPEALL